MKTKLYIWVIIVLVGVTIANIIYSTYNYLTVGTGITNIAISLALLITLNPFIKGLINDIIDGQKYQLLSTSYILVVKTTDNEIIVGIPINVKNATDEGLLIDYCFGKDKIITISVPNDSYNDIKNRCATVVPNLKQLILLENKTC